MAKHSKRYRDDAQHVELDKGYPLKEAVEKIKSFRSTRSDQSVDICMHLGIDSKQADQGVRGSISLPHGTGKSRRVVAFVPAERADEAKEAGAIEAGAEDLVAKIEGGWMDFDVAVATPDMMRVVSKLGRTLGPRGLMPSPKSGTVTPDVVQAVKDYAAGKVEFRNDDGGNIHAVIGKLSFAPDQLEANAQFFIDNIMRMKPTSTKGQYLKKISLSGTMTPGVAVEI